MAEAWKLVPCTEEGYQRKLAARGILTEVTIRAAERAVQVHSGQRRDNGASTLEEHIFPVAVGVVESMLPKSPEPPDEYRLLVGSLAVAAVLHDTFEDSPKLQPANPYAYAECAEEFGPSIAGTVLLLTKQPHQRGNLQAYYHVIEGSPPGVQRIKIVDRSKNLSSSIVLALERGSLLEPKHQLKFLRYVQETRDVYLPIAIRLGDLTLVRRLSTLIKKADQVIVENDYHVPNGDVAVLLTGERQSA